MAKTFMVITSSYLSWYLWMLVSVFPLLMTIIVWRKLRCLHITRNNVDIGIWKWLHFVRQFFSWIFTRKVADVLARIKGLQFSACQRVCCVSSPSPLCSLLSPLLSISPFSTCRCFLFCSIFLISHPCIPLSILSLLFYCPLYAFFPSPPQEGYGEYLLLQQLGDD